MLTPIRETNANPMVVLTCIQMGLTAASLFGPKGADIGDLIKAQTEILLGISHKIDTIMAAIKVLDARLAELKQLVRDVPDETVKALKVVEIYGSSNRLFLEVLPGYEMDRNALGIVEANNIWVPRVQSEILPTLASARSQLMTLQNPFAIPALCSALIAERTALAFVSASEGQKRTTLDVYKSHFQEQIKVCSGMRANIAQEHAAIWREIEDYVPEERICYRPETAKGSSVEGCVRGEYMVQVAGYGRTAPLPPDIRLFEQPEYSALAKAGYLVQENLPPKLDDVYRRSSVTDVAIDYFFGCPGSGGHATPIGWDKLIVLVGNRYGSNIARTMYEEGRFCPTPDSGNVTDIITSKVEVLKNSFDENCFYCAMQFAAEQAAASLIS
ncbi:hypothetical protein ACYZT4_17650 [Pseudomonas sp. GB2N2]